MEKIPDRLWLNEAMNLIPGADTKIIHKGCGTRASLFIRNDDDKYWCYCHRCRGGGFKDKVLPRIKQKLSTKTGWMPDTLIPIVEAICTEPYNFRDLLARFNLAHHVTRLTYCRSTQRVYIPDTSGSYLGLDATFKANARFYSPLGRNLAVSPKAGGTTLCFVSGIEAYLSLIANGNDVVLVMNKKAEQAALAVLSDRRELYDKVIVSPSLSSNFIRDSKAFL